MKRPNSHQLFEEAKKYLPGGVNSPVRAFNAVGGDPVFVTRAEGAFLFDEDGNRYIDLINSWGPMILGHVRKEVVRAVSKSLKDSFSFGTPTKIETEIARLITDQFSHVERIRFVNSGTEACMSAIRLARGYTGRDYIIKFRGCYHGHADDFLVSAGSGAMTFSKADSDGVPEGAVMNTLLADYNDIESVTELFKRYGGDIAAVIIEPVAGNMGCVVPKEKFLKRLESICHEYGSLFILDEVMTGFRLSFGGAVEQFDLNPDIVCYGKIIGGGMPVGAFAGREEIFKMLAPIGPVYQAGTLSGNPIAMTAGLATLKILSENPEIYQKIDQNTQLLAEGLSELFTVKKIKAKINRFGSMMSVFFTDREVVDYQSAKTSDTELYKKFFHGMLDRGVYLPPSNFESWFVSEALGEEHVGKIIEIAGKVVETLKR